MLFIVGPTAKHAEYYRNTLIMASGKQAPCASPDNLDVRGVQSYTMFVVNMEQMTPLQLRVLRDMRARARPTCTFIYVSLP